LPFEESTIFRDSSPLHVCANHFDVAFVEHARIRERNRQIKRRLSATVGSSASVFHDE
jgi:hypothetical protein